MGMVVPAVTFLVRPERASKILPDEYMDCDVRIIFSEYRVTTQDQLYFRVSRKFESDRSLSQARTFLPSFVPLLWSLFPSTLLSGWCPELID
jgi:hypothetical protein